MNLRFAFIISCLFSCHAAQAAIPHGLRSSLSRTFVFKPILRDSSRGFDIAAIQPVSSLRDVAPSDVAKIIPYREMHETTDSGLVAQQILDCGLSTWFNSDAVRNSDVGRTAHRVEKSMESDVSFGGTQSDSVKHQLKFLLKATQTKAEVEYSGLTNAQFTYFIFQNKTDIEMRESIESLSTQVVYNQIYTRSESTQLLSLRWIW